jgi:hypothetical protein
LISGGNYGQKKDPISDTGQGEIMRYCPSAKNGESKNMNCFKKIGTIMLAATILFSGAALGFDDRGAKLSLEKLPAISVLVDPLREEIEKDGLLRSDILELVTQKLQMAGIRIAPDGTELEGNPVLHIRPVIIKLEKRKVYHCAIYVIFYQDVYLVRNPGQKIHGAITWMEQTIGESPDLERIKVHVGYKVDEFIKDYLSANPKEGTMDKLKELKKYIK